MHHLTIEKNAEIKKWVFYRGKKRLGKRYFKEAVIMGSHRLLLCFRHIVKIQASVLLHA